MFTRCCLAFYSLLFTCCINTGTSSLMLPVYCTNSFFFSLVFRVCGRRCRWMRRSWMQLSARLGVSFSSSLWGRAANSKVKMFIIKCYLNIFLFLLSFLFFIGSKQVLNLSASFVLPASCLGFARLASESHHGGSPIHWVLPAGMNAKMLGGVFKIDWLCR